MDPATPREQEPAPTVALAVGARLDGLDAARALAFTGMVLAHFAHAVRVDDPGWLQAIDGAADGRAAPLFCVLLGVGVGLLIERGGDDRMLVRRGLVLLALGLALWPVVDRVWLILPHYGVLLLAAPGLRRVPTRWLLPVAAGLFLVPATVTALVGATDLRGVTQPSRYLDLLDPVALAGQLAWTGGYPLVGWTGFVLVGLWLARQPLRDRRALVRLLVAGVAVAALQPLAAAVARAAEPSSVVEPAAWWRPWVDGQAHSSGSAWYILASATAVAAVAGCLLVGERGSLLRPLVPLGRMALSAYLAHLAVGAAFVWRWRDDARPSLAVQMALALVVVAVGAALAAAWGRGGRRGPVEVVLRAVSDRRPPPTAASAAAARSGT